MSTRIIFLGTGGGRHATIYQTRSTGGFILDSGQRIHVDPGPSAIVNMRKLELDPLDTDSILISHCHPDHYSDAEVLIEGMCNAGATRRGNVIGSVSVLEGTEGIGPCISSYHQRLAEYYRTVRPGDSFGLNGMRIDATRSVHSDPSTVGFRFHTADGVVSYVSDTEYSEEIAEQHIGSRLLILPITTPDGRRIPFHMCTEDAIPFVEVVKPELTVFVHMGIYVTKLGPEQQAERVADSTGSRVIAARDLMEIVMGDTIETIMPR